MRRTWKPTALVVLAALGFAVSAYAKPARWRPPVFTTTTAITATTATTTAATTTSPPPASASVTITSPPAYSYYTRGGTALVSGTVRTAPGQTVTCVVDWAEQGATSSTVATETSPGVYSCCPVGHVFVTAGTHALTLTATVDGAPVGASTRVVTVF